MIFLRVALSVTAIVLFIGTASFAQGGEQGGDAMPGEQAEATGMPTPLSSSRQKVQSAKPNAQAGISSAVVDAKAGADNANDPVQRYQGQLQHN
jgi:hypothetical protein